MRLNDMNNREYERLLDALDTLGFQLNEDDILTEEGTPFPLGETLAFNATGDMNESELNLKELLMVLEKAHFTTSKPNTDISYKLPIIKLNSSSLYTNYSRKLDTLSSTDYPEIELNKTIVKTDDEIEWATGSYLTDQPIHENHSINTHSFFDDIQKSHGIEVDYNGVTIPDEYKEGPTPYPSREIAIPDLPKQSYNYEIPREYTHIGIHKIPEDLPTYVYEHEPHNESHEIKLHEDSFKDYSHTDDYPHYAEVMREGVRIVEWYGWFGFELSMDSQVITDDWASKMEEEFEEQTIAFFVWVSDKYKGNTGYYEDYIEEYAQEIQVKTLNQLYDHTTNISAIGKVYYENLKQRASDEWDKYFDGVDVDGEVDKDMDRGFFYQATRKKEQKGND